MRPDDSVVQTLNAALAASSAARTRADLESYRALEAAIDWALPYDPESSAARRQVVLVHYETGRYEDGTVPELWSRGPVGRRERSVTTRPFKPRPLRNRNKAPAERGFQSDSWPLPHLTRSHQGLEDERRWFPIADHFRRSCMARLDERQVLEEVEVDEDDESMMPATTRPTPGVLVHRMM